MTKDVMHGIVIFCFDPRAEANLWKDVKAELIKPEKRLFPVSCLGAPTALARPADFPIKFAYIMEEIQDAFGIFEFAQKKFVVVGHDCGIYKRVPYLVTTPFNSKVADIISAGRLLKTRFPEIPTVAWCKKPESSASAQFLARYNSRMLKQTGKFQQVYLAQ